MVTFFFGKTGTGKTEAVLCEIEAQLANGGHVILLCPEQEAVIAERRLTARLSGKVPTQNLEVLNFGRLPNRVCREVGGLTDTPLGNGGKRLILAGVLSELAPLLWEYQNAGSDPAALDRILAAISECKMGCAKPGDLERAAAMFSQNHAPMASRLHKKVSDLSLIYAAYEARLHTAYHDAADELDILCTALDDSGNGFFAGKHVYIDGFFGFTAQQYHVLSRIFSLSENVTVTLPCDSGDVREKMYRRVEETKRNLLSLLRKLGITPQIRYFTENQRTTDGELLSLWDHLWRIGETEKQSVEPTGAVRVLPCGDVYAEAEAVACDIKEAIYGGAKYRDIAIILRGTTAYEGVLDTVLSKYGIPCYMAKRSSIMSKSFFKYIHALFSIAIYNTRQKDLLELLKTGLTGIDEEDAFLFENYIVTWNLSGRALATEEEYAMHPRGFVAHFNDRDKKVLARVNRVREALFSSLVPFCEELRASNLTVRDIARILYTFLDETHMPRMLDDTAEGLRTSGEVTEAAEQAQIWQMFVSSLDTLVTVSGDMPCLASDFISLYDLLLSDYAIGTIPARGDELTVGDAGIFRFESLSRVYIMGANDGVFPKDPTDDGFFTDEEKALLGECGIALSPISADAAHDERFLFYNAVTAAKNSLVITYPTQSLSGSTLHPSQGVLRVLACLSREKPKEIYVPNDEKRLWAELPAFEQMAADTTSSLGIALHAHFTERARENPMYEHYLRALETPLTVHRNRLNEETMDRLFGRQKVISMSQSRLERYAKCHFAYFCNYELKLSKNARAQFDALNMGTFVHYVLEKFFARYLKDGADAFADDKAISTLIEELLYEYLESVCHVSMARQTPRMRGLFARLKRSAVLVVKNLIDEFRQSEFVPRDFELVLGEGEDAVKALEIPLGDGTLVRLNGKIDRVDTYEKDGVTYLRVVDYKSSAKKLSLDDVRAGINMQMLLYLYAIWKNGTRYGEQRIPAAVLYKTDIVKEKTSKVLLDGNEAEAEIMKDLRYTGLFLDDISVLRAMDQNLAGAIIPIKVKKDGTLSASSSLISLEGFGALMNDITHTVTELVEGIRKGNADIDPDHDPEDCKHCDYRAMCRTQ